MSFEAKRLILPLFWFKLLNMSFNHSIWLNNSCLLKVNFQQIIIESNKPTQRRRILKIWYFPSLMPHQPKLSIEFKLEHYWKIKGTFVWIWLKFVQWLRRRCHLKLIVYGDRRNIGQRVISMEHLESLTKVLEKSSYPILLCRFENNLAQIIVSYIIKVLVHEILPRQDLF